MPEYLFINPDDPDEIVSVNQSMNEEHKYESNGKEWERCFTVPKASIDSKINPESRSEFVEKTRNKKGTLGDLWDASKEMSERRKDIYGGDDPVAKKHYSDYSKKRNGMKHQKDPSKKLGNDHVEVSI